MKKLLLEVVMVQVQVAQWRSTTVRTGGTLVAIRYYTHHLLAMMVAVVVVVEVMAAAAEMPIWTPVLPPLLRRRGNHPDHRICSHQTHTAAGLANSVNNNHISPISHSNPSDPHRTFSSHGSSNTIFPLMSTKVQATGSLAAASVVVIAKVMTATGTATMHASP